MTNPVQDNAPVTAASIVAAVQLNLAAFTDLSALQISAVMAGVGIAAAVVVQRWHTDPKTPR